MNEEGAGSVAQTPFLSKPNFSKVTQPIVHIHRVAVPSNSKKNVSVYPVFRIVRFGSAARLLWSPSLLCFGINCFLDAQFLSHKKKFHIAHFDIFAGNLVSHGLLVPFWRDPLTPSLCCDSCPWIGQSLTTKEIVQEI